MLLFASHLFMEHVLFLEGNKCDKTSTVRVQTEILFLVFFFFLAGQGGRKRRREGSHRRPLGEGPSTEVRRTRALRAVVVFAAVSTVSNKEVKELLSRCCCSC